MSVMHSSTVIFLINCVLLVSSVASLCISSSLFDFIVMNKLYYTQPDKRVIIDSDIAYWFFGAPVVTLLLSFCLTSYSQTPRTLKELAWQYPFVLSVLHGVLLSFCSCISAYCAYLSMETSREVGKFAFEAIPLQFQHASFWYFIRFRAAAILFAIESVFSMAVLVILYFGIQCEYRTFAPLPQQTKEPFYSVQHQQLQQFVEGKPDIVLKTNYFA